VAQRGTHFSAKCGFFFVNSTSVVGPVIGAGKRIVTSAPSATYLTRPASGLLVLVEM